MIYCVDRHTDRVIREVLTSAKAPNFNKLIGKWTENFDHFVKIAVVSEPNLEFRFQVFERAILEDGQVIAERDSLILIGMVEPILDHTITI